MNDPTSTEVIEWFLSDTAVPDSETTVLIHCPNESEPVWFGYFDSTDQIWHTIEGDDEIEVIAWANLPKGV